MTTCPYHGNQNPCRECLIRKMGAFAHPKPGTCPYHGKHHPCIDCLDRQMGQFAHQASRRPAIPYVPPHRRNRPVHFHQKARDTCAVACCAMAGATLNCPQPFDQQSLLSFMERKGIYRRGEMSLPALDHPIKWLGLRCEMRVQQSLDDVRGIVRGGDAVVILEVVQHVIVVFDANEDGTLVIGDPAMHRVETDVPVTDYRLKQQHPGRIWIVRK